MGLKLLTLIWGGDWRSILSRGLETYYAMSNSLLSEFLVPYPLLSVTFRGQGYGQGESNELPHYS